MKKGLKLTKFFTSGAVALLSTVFWCSQGTASGKAKIERREIRDSAMVVSNGEYLSSVLKTDFKFNVFGVAWQGRETVGISLRYHDSSGWSKWQQIEDYLERDGWYYSTDPIVANKGTELQYKVDSSANLKNIKLIYLGESSGSNFKKRNIFDFLFSKAQAADSLEIIPRSEWGADEDWRFSGSDKEIWPASYQRPEKFVIHHTAGSTGGDNPAAAVRGVYYWHSTVLGWGDIGYNYLIDQNGNIYEGRYGGDGVIGAHVYRTKICARFRFGGEQYEADFNKGTIGIAVLGNYEDGLTLNSKVKNALADLIAVKGKEFGIEPKGEGYMIDNTYPHIVGHKDLDCTACPGTNLYQKLGTIRDLAQKKYDVLNGIADPIIKATYVQQSKQSLAIDTGKEKQFWVEFKNEGNVTWHNYGINQPYVIAKNPPSVLKGSDWEAESIVAYLDSPNVAPGEIGRFTFNLKAPIDLLETSESFSLAFDNKIQKKSEFQVTVKITNLPFAAKLKNRSINLAMFLNDTQLVTFEFRNEGINSWKKGEVRLNIYDLDDQISRFYDKSWNDQYGQLDFEETEVKTNKIATFTLKLKAPRELGIFKNIYRLIGKNEIIQEENHSVTRIDSPYQAKLVSQNIPLAVLNYWKIPVTVKFENTGIGTWDQNLILNVYDLGKKTSRFKDSSWENTQGQFSLKEKAVKSGDIGTFQLILKAPEGKGVYLHILELKIKGSDLVVQNGEASLITRVDS